jgi:hypothetical protein
VIEISLDVNRVFSLTSAGLTGALCPSTAASITRLASAILDSTRGHA